MAEPLPVSVVIPAYRRPEMVARSVLTALAQHPRPPAEVIVVDDGSGDGTAESAELAGARVVRLPENRGKGHARNAGIEAATQEWIGFLDSDDEWLPNTLERLWGERADHVLVGGAYFICGSGARNDRYQGPPRGRPFTVTSPRSLIYPENPFGASATIARRDVVLAVGGFDPALPHCEDLDLWLRVLERGTGRMVPEPLMLYHVHSGQISSQHSRTVETQERILANYASRRWHSRARVEMWRGSVGWDERRVREGGGSGRGPFAGAAGPAALLFRAAGVAGILGRRVIQRRRTRDYTHRELGLGAYRVTGRGTTAVSETLPVSVVIPAFNRPEMTARAVRSALAQQPAGPAEVIVVDDCSTDGTGAAAEAAGARVIRREVNGGEGASRNTGIASATQEWVAFLDSDDEWLPHMLATLWPHRDGQAFVTGAYLMAWDDPERDRYQGPPGRKPFTLSSPRQVLYPESPVAASGVLVRRSALGDLRFDEDLKYCADLDLWLRLLERGTAVVVPEPVVLWHQHGGQVSGNHAAMTAGQEAVVGAYTDRPWYSEARMQLWRGAVGWDERRLPDRGDGSGPFTGAHGATAKALRAAGVLGILARRVGQRRRGRGYDRAVLRRGQSSAR